MHKKESQLYTLFCSFLFSFLLQILMSVIRHHISVPLDAVKIQKEVSYVFAKLDSWPVKMELTALVITSLLYRK